MAGLREIALGLATALQSPGVPDPLPVTFWGESLVDAAELLALVARECSDAGVPLRRVEVDPVLARYLRDSRRVVGVPVAANPELSGEARFFRREAAATSD